ncbi:hypothetical protein GO988_02440 [Hymenobacter sp. HMF4947]|uniref:DUF1795 domain-containing protein n=1 Tax=Hymenobacter ginkgonis TaxID=2682976 RepID=A0A7K1T9V3_9BACT|nr:hypothetical protein [Hymenobacter ginkgonis]MVN75175.1 hypothetical protein [Hymenobacter ginkgonis]
MNYCYALLCCLLLHWPATAQQRVWQAYPIDQQLTVRFPAPPQQLDVSATMAANNSPSRDSLRVQTSQAFRVEDATANYILVSIPLLTAQPHIGTTSEREAYYKSRGIPLMVAQLHGELLEQTVSTTPELDSFTVKLRTLTVDGSSGVKYVRVLTTNTRIYQLYFIPKDKTGEIGTAQRTQFFDASILVRGK